MKKSAKFVESPPKFPGWDATLKKTVNIVNIGYMHIAMALWMPKMITLSMGFNAQAIEGNIPT